MKKILIIDDDLLNLHVLDILLKTNGFEVLQASNGAEALEIAQKDPPDMVVSDILMPVMDGFNLCRAWMKDERFRTIPFIFYTATYTDNKDEAFALSLGAKRFLIKPVAPEILLSILREVLADGENNGTINPQEPAIEEDTFYREYNEILIRKLEDKMVELEQTNKHLEMIVELRTKELQEVHERLLRNEKLALVGQISGGVAHELRNPLSVISNAVYYLNLINPATDETTREYLDLLSSEVRSMERIIMNMLDFSRIQEASKEPVDIPNLIGRILTNHPAPENVEVNSLFPGNFPSAFVDPLQMEQVILNLMTNAYQAMLKGGNLMIEGRVVQVHDGMVASPSTESAAEDMAILFRDTGCGISKENKSKIFEPLFTTKPRGIGLGLPLCKNLVELNGGRIEVDSEVGNGSTFTVYFPLDPQGR